MISFLKMGSNRNSGDGSWLGQVATNHERYVILVVEDEPFARMIAVDVLVEHGMRVLEATAQLHAPVISARGQDADGVPGAIRAIRNLFGGFFSKCEFRRLRREVAVEGGGCFRQPPSLDRLNTNRQRRALSNIERQSLGSLPIVSAGKAGAYGRRPAPD